MTLLKIVIMSLTCFGALRAINTFLWKIKGVGLDDIEPDFSKWEQFILSPVLFCVYCTASFWGSLAYLGMAASGYGFSLFEWLICVIATCGLNEIIERNT